MTVQPSSVSTGAAADSRSSVNFLPSAVDHLQAKQHGGYYKQVFRKYTYCTTAWSHSHRPGCTRASHLVKTLQCWYSYTDSSRTFCASFGTSIWNRSVACMSVYVMKGLVSNMPECASHGRKVTSPSDCPSLGLVSLNCLSTGWSVRPRESSFTTASPIGKFSFGRVSS